MRMDGYHPPITLWNCYFMALLHYIISVSLRTSAHTGVAIRSLYGLSATNDIVREMRIATVASSLAMTVGSGGEAEPWHPRFFKCFRETLRTIYGVRRGRIPQFLGKLNFISENNVYFLLNRRIGRIFWHKSLTLFLQCVTIWLHCGQNSISSDPVQTIRR